VRVRVEELSATKRKLRVQIPPSTVKETVDEVYRDLRRRVKLKGFRPGKVPIEVLKRLYREQAHREAISQLIEKTYPEAISRKSLEPVSAPQIEPGDFSPEKSFTYTALLEVKPPVDLKRYKGLEVKVGKKGRVTDKEVREEIERLRNLYGRLKTAEGRKRVKKGDWVLLDFEGFLDGRPIKDSRAENYLLEVGSGTMVPGFEEALIGMEVGKEGEFRVTFPQDHPRRDLAGREVLFRAKVKEIREKILPELDDEFAKDLGVTDVKALRKKVREELERRKEEDYRRRVREALLDELISSNPMEVPSSLLQGRAQAIYERWKREEGGDTDERAWEACMKAAERDIKTAFLLEEIARREGIEVKEEEVEERLKEISKRTGRDLRLLRNDDRVVDGVRTELLNSKVVDLLMEEAHIS